jgi:glycosyltransferase involved in cell wall biosynthesis
VLRIVIDARSVVARRSGIGNYVESLIRHLVPMATDVQFLLLRHPSASAPIVVDDRVTELAFPGETKSVATVFRLGRTHDFADFDLYHSPADLVPLGLRCPFVVTIHDLMWLEAPRLASAFMPVRVANALWYRHNIARSIGRANAVISISHATAAAIERVFPDHFHKVSVVHHGMDTARYDASRAGPRSELERFIPGVKRYALIVGQGSPYKNHVGMVRAFVEATADEPDHKLVLVRRFSRIDREMSRLLQRADVAAKIVTVPFVPDDALLTLYRHATMLLFASHYEGFGLPALEAMAVGTPVLGSTAAAVQEITGDAALHADPANHADLVEKIRALTEDAVRTRLAARGEQRVRAFSWHVCAERTLAVYRRAAALGR